MSHGLLHLCRTVGRQRRRNLARESGPIHHRPRPGHDALRTLDDDNLALETPPDPRTGATLVILDPPEWIYRIATPIPQPPGHCQRFYGAYSNRGRMVRSREQGAGDPAAQTPEERDNSDCSREARSTWARLIRKIFEAEPLVCTCGARMRIVSFITEPRVIDRILRHWESNRRKTEHPFEPRAPQLAPGGIFQ
jgi:hypothetical protein